MSGSMGLGGAWADQEETWEFVSLCPYLPTQACWNAAGNRDATAFVGGSRTRIKAGHESEMNGDGTVAPPSRRRWTDRIQLG